MRELTRCELFECETSENFLYLLLFENYPHCNRYRLPSHIPRSRLISPFSTLAPCMLANGVGRCTVAASVLPMGRVRFWERAPDSPVSLFLLTYYTLPIA